MSDIYKEVGRFGAYGIAKLKARQIEEVSKKKTLIFKDLSNTPFTSFRTDQYVVVALMEDNK